MQNVAIETHFKAGLLSPCHHWRPAEILQTPVTITDLRTEIWTQKLRHTKHE